MVSLPNLGLPWFSECRHDNISKGFFAAFLQDKGLMIEKNMDFPVHLCNITFNRAYVRLEEKHVNATAMAGWQLSAPDGFVDLLQS